MDYLFAVYAVDPPDALFGRYGYPPDLQKDAVKLVMDQAMLFGEEWALVSS